MSDAHNPPHSTILFAHYTRTTFSPTPAPSVSFNGPGGLQVRLNLLPQTWLASAGQNLVDRQWEMIACLAAAAANSCACFVMNVPRFILLPFLLRSCLRLGLCDVGCIVSEARLASVILSISTA
eukprot:m.677724 g.677724  ORF g.677724 m.677724 type:complete len:124 (+) comp58573_c0_seq3:401-772(+)